MGVKVWSGAVGANDGSSWANAYVSFTAMFAANTAGGVDVDVATDHVDPDYVWYPSAPNQVATPFNIRSVNRANDQYLKATTPQIDTSAMNYEPDLRSFVNALSGLYIKTKYGAEIGQADKPNTYRDLTVLTNTIYAGMEWSFNGPTDAVNCRFENAGGGSVFCLLLGDEFRWSNIVFTGKAKTSNPFFDINAQRTDIAAFGLDCSGILNASAIFNWGYGATYRISIVVEGGKTPSGMPLFTTDIPYSDLTRAVLSNIDTGDGVPRNFVYDYRGKMTTTTAVYKTSGFKHHLNNQSMARIAAANANCKESRPFAAQSILTSTDTAGLHTFTLELLEDYTTALTTRDFYLRVEAPSGASGALRKVYDVALEPASNLAAGAGTGAWTDPPGGARSVKATAQVVLDHAGMVKVTPVLARYEAGKSVWYDPVVTVT